MSVRPIPLVAIPALISCVVQADINTGAFRGMSVRRIGEQRLQQCARFSCP
jgi:hypothetical protein